ncbi:MAG: hypothetical protein JXB49_17690 [Bacteroidales bacterium]|nr:hypothetical protein [Bacteroidales bacterium]
MLSKIIGFELYYRLRRPATYIYFLIIFGFTFLLVTLPETSIAGAGEKLHVNSPYIINSLIISFLVYGSFICAAICGVPVYRDFEHDSYELIFTTHVKKGQYIWGRFIGSYIFTLIIMTSTIPAIIIGSAMPWVEDSATGPFMLNAYIYAFFVFIIPNTLIFCLLFFSIGSYLRSQVAIFTQAVVFIIIYFTIALTTKDIDTSPWMTLFDPFGSNAYAEMTKYWTAVEKNTLLLPFRGLILYNRLFWLAIAAIIAVLFHKGFRFTVTAPFSRFTKRISKDTGYDKTLAQTIQVPGFTSAGTFRESFSQWWGLTWFHFSKIITSVAFIILVLCSIGFVLMSQMGLKMLYGTTQLPVTYVLIDTLSGNFSLFLIIIATIYAGEVMWKEISRKFAQIADSTPISNHRILLSKFSAIVLMELFTLFLMMITGMILQVTKGFFDFQVAIYLSNIFLISLPYFIIITFFIFFIHTLVHNKFLAHGIVVGFYIFSGFFPKIGLRHLLVRYGHIPTEMYSGLNGYDKFYYPTLVTELYWILFGVVLFTLCFLLLKRGVDLRFKVRVRNMCLSLKQGYGRGILTGSLILFIATGAFIYYNTNVLNVYQTEKEKRSNSVEYEKKFKKYEDYPQPVIAGINLHVELYPEQLIYDVKGRYILVNTGDVPIDTFHVMLRPELTVNNLDFEDKANLVEEFKAKGFRMYEFEQSFAPHDTMFLDFQVSYHEKGFTNGGRNTYLLPNGTFLHSDFLPLFGYEKGLELSNKRKRKKEGLPERKEDAFYSLYDSSHYDKVMISPNAHRIAFEAVIGTQADQIAITCGELVDSWQENNRGYFHYKAEKPIWNFFTILSARYEIIKEEYKGISLEIYHHPGHTYNTGHLMDGMKKTIDYCSENFSPFHHKNLRIVEIPRYFGGAQSFATTIPSSESSGFIVDMDKKNDLNLPFYLAAHEVAHQWWGHQVWSAQVKGMNMLSESLANYTALMVMEKEFGTEEIGKYLRHELEMYLMQRALEQKKEVPVYEVEFQNYVAYQKGSLAFYALKDVMGEDSVNKALQQFVADYAYKAPPYPTSLDLIAYIRDYTPDSVQSLVTDLFQKIVVYENKTDSVRYTKLNENQYKVTIGVNSIKYETDTSGSQKELLPDDYIDIGVYTENGSEDSLIFIKKYHLTEKSNIFEVIVNNEPSKAGIDPQYKLIDRNLDDNTKKAEERSL